MEYNSLVVFLFWIGFVMVFLLGLCFGSFTNVLIYRIPEKETVVTGGSHCRKCDYHLKWYDNIPLLSYILLKGKCRQCGEKISVQYPLVELGNAILWILIYIWYGYSWQTVIYCGMATVFITISFIDFRTYEIPPSQNVVLLVLGVILTIVDFIRTRDWHILLDHGIGMICVSLFLAVVYFITAGKGIGFGDVKLMFTVGLIVGWKIIVVGFFIGCILAIIIHTIRMKVKGEKSRLAFGPYLSAGVYISLFVGKILMNMYLGMLGIS